MDKIMLLDGNSLINRAFYGIRLLTTKEGLHTNAVYGFINMLSKYMAELQPTHIAAAFDVAAPTFRHKRFAAYKATRHATPPELLEQMPLLKEVLAAMNISIVEKAGYEADDLIGTMARAANEQGAECVIVTGDRDDLQLISAQTKVYLIVTRNRVTTEEIWDEQKMLEEYGVTPAQFIDVKALMGDKSDNIPGVAGIGEKRALEMVKTLGGLDGIYAHLDDGCITKANRARLEAEKETAYESQLLCTIDRHAPISFTLDDHVCKPHDAGRLREIYTRLEFKKFLTALGDAADAPSARAFEDGDYRFAANPAQVAEAAAAIQNEEELFLYLHPLTEEECRIAVGLPNRRCFVLSPGGSVSWEECLRVLAPALESEHIAKTADDLGAFIVRLARYGIALRGPLFDVGIAAYLLKPSASDYKVEALCEEYTGISVTDGLDAFGLEQEHYFCARLALSLPEIKRYQQERLAAEQQEALFTQIEMPLVPILAEMQLAGFSIDRERLTEYRETLADRLAVVEQEIYQLAGETFNISSPKQLGVILFEKLGLFAAKKNKRGYSTGVDALERIRDDHPIVERILEYRQLSKLKSTYADGLLTLMDPATGKIHSKFNQTVAVTGRISSQDPNLQSIPIRQELGRELRKVFVAESPDYVLVGADYSQIELRVLAHLCGDDVMLEAFRNGGDIHAETAAGIFHVAPEEVTLEMRSRAKTVNFGIIYGMGDYGLATDLKISRKEARAYIAAYYEKHPKVEQYMNETIEQAKECGYVTTMFHRKRYVPELQSSNFTQRNFGRRVAMNTPIQGSAADIIKLAMIRVAERLRGMRSRLVLQVHDELIVQAHVEEADAVKELLQYEMEHVCTLKAPLKAEVSVGHSWYDTK